MILPETKAEIRRLVLADGWKIETVARRFGVHHSVVRRATRTEPVAERSPVPPSALEPFKPYIVSGHEDPQVSGASRPALCRPRRALHLSAFS